MNRRFIHLVVATIFSLIVALFSVVPTHAAFLNFVEFKQDGVAGVDGLNGTFSVAVSPDGSHVYAASRFDNAVAVFSRNALTGTLQFVEAKKDAIGGVDGLGGATSVQVSPDGANVYVASLNDSAVGVFHRNTSTGALTFVEAKKDGIDGTDGINGTISVAISPDGKSVYATGFTESAIAVFSRNATTGALTFLTVYRDDVGGADGLQQPIFITTSPDNQHVYVGGVSANDGIAVYSRDTTTGALAFVELYKSFGTIDGLSGGQSIAFSADGLFAYVASSVSLIVFSRDPATGKLSHLETFRESFDGVTGLLSAMSVAVSPDGNQVYVASQGSALAVFSRNNTTGRLTFIEAQKDSVGGVDGLNTAQAVAVSPDSTHIYTGSQIDDAVAVFRISGQQVATSTPTETHTNTATATDTPTMTTTPSSTGLYLPIVIKPDLPTATPTATASPTASPTATRSATPTATTTSAPGGVWQISVNDAFKVSQLTCRQGLDTIIITPKAGYALFIADLNLRNSQQATVSSSSIAVIDSGGTRWDVLGEEFGGSYCPSTFVSQYSPGNRNSKFAFAVSASMLAQPFSFRFADATPVNFTVR